MAPRAIVVRRDAEDRAAGSHRRRDSPTHATAANLAASRNHSGTSAGTGSPAPGTSHRSPWAGRQTVATGQPRGHAAARWALGRAGVARMCEAD